MFDDFLSSIGSMFGAGDSSAKQPAAGNVAGILPGEWDWMDKKGKPGTPGQNGGGGDLLSSLILGVGPMVLSRIMGAGDQKNIDQSMKALKGNMGSATKAGQMMVDRASAGKLTDAQQASVDKMKSEQNARMQQRFAELGIPVSTMQSQAANQVDTNAQEFANKLINESMSQGLQALGLGSQTAQSLLASAMQSKRDLANTIGEVAKQIGMVWNTPQRPDQQQQRTQVPSEWGTWNPEEGIFAATPADPYAA